MKGWLRRGRFLLEYAAILLPYLVIRLLPHWLVKFQARLISKAMSWLPPVRKVCLANIATAFPESSPRERRRICRQSLFHLIFNMFEFIWMTGKPKRIERWTRLGGRIDGELKKHVAEGRRVIFVNPHLGSWEASGLMAPYYSGMDLVAIAKPMRNPYLNRLLNGGNRERNAGVHIIFSNGAARASWYALRDGASLGTLVDQNTRVRDGGIFVDFFGLPVPGSRLPVTLWRRCRQEGIPVVLGVAATLRRADGGLQPEFDYPLRDLDEFADDREVLQELTRMSETLIRMFPEQYLWFYKRFQYIPREADAALASRYPYYARRAPDKFYRKTVNQPMEGPDE